MGNVHLNSQFTRHPFIERLQDNFQQSKHLICVGLDPDLARLPSYYESSVEGVFSFLMDVVESSLDYCLCYKPNISFFEALGIDGLRMLQKLVQQIPQTHPVIIDAKRGDIGNTSNMQARYIFDVLGADATTLHPYMGDDSLTPFFEYRDKYHFVLGLTSNEGAAMFEKLSLLKSELLYERVIKQCVNWNRQYGNVGVVVGATQTELASIRSIDSELLFLIPGVGTQGGSYEMVFQDGVNTAQLALINISRGLLYGSDDKITSLLLSERLKYFTSSV